MDTSFEKKMKFSTQEAKKRKKKKWTPVHKTVLIHHRSIITDDCAGENYYLPKDSDFDPDSSTLRFVVLYLLPLNSLKIKNWHNSSPTASEHILMITYKNSKFPSKHKITYRKICLVMLKWNYIYHKLNKIEWIRVI